MAMMSDVELPLAALRNQVGSGVELVVVVSRLPDGSRKITHVTEVLDFDFEQQRYRLQDLLVRRYAGTDERGRIVSELVTTGVVPSFLPRLAQHGVELSRAAFRAMEGAQEAAAPKGDSQ
jgi:pilus assembly protein CpaF